MAISSFDQVVFDIPHGGQQLPNREMCGYEDFILSIATKDHPGHILNPFAIAHLSRAITKVDLLSGTDLYSKGVYADMEGIPFENKVFFKILRTIIDVNRELHDHGTANPDGIIKTKTNLGKRLYRDEGGLPDDIIKALLKNYAKPYYEKLFKAVEKRQTKLVILGHTMESTKPKADGTRGEKRPLITIANGGDRDGKPNASYQLSRDLMSLVAEEITRRIKAQIALHQPGNQAGINLEGVEYNGQIVTINTPFPGRESMARIGPDRLQNKKTLMFEINKGLFTETTPTTISDLPDCQKNLKAIRAIIQDVIEMVLQRI